MIKRKIETDFMEFKPEEAETEEQKLLQSALQASLHAYAPYSHFKVGAAALIDNGTIVTGSNQENEAYPSGLCAERVTLFHAGHQFPDNKIKALAITAVTNDKQIDMITPCGACRQVILEYERRQGLPIKIYLYGTKGVIKIESAAELLPLAFSL